MTSDMNLVVAIPVFNHARTLRRVVEGSLAVIDRIIVVDDGSTDRPEDAVRGLPVEFLRHNQNLGKGAAILTAAAKAREIGATHIVIIDADGQHSPTDIPRLATVACSSPLAIVVGKRDLSVPNVPASTRFGRAFSNFWLRVQTGVTLGDVQSGFRVYPLAVLASLDLDERRYSFEVEVLVKAAWAGFPLLEVDISVYYPSPGERVSHFHVLTDNIRISKLNTLLTMRAMIPVPHRQYAINGHGTISVIHPLHSIRILLGQHQTPLLLGLSSGLGVFLGSLPLIGLHSILILFCASYFRLSKITALATSQLCMPPIAPALCIEIGYFLRHGRFLTEISLTTLGYQGGERLLEWGIGSLILAPAAAVIVSAVVWSIAQCVRLTLKEAA